MTDKPVRRMTLRQLLVQSEKCSRDLAEYVHASLMPRITDVRELSRPVRKRSHFPTLLAMQNALRRLEEAEVEARVRTDYLYEMLLEIREHAQKERFSRMKL